MLFRSELTIGPVRRCYLVEEFQWIPGRERAEQVPKGILGAPPRAYARMKKEKSTIAIVEAFIEGISKGNYKRTVHRRKRRGARSHSTEAQRPKKRRQDQLAGLRDKRYRRVKALVYLERRRRVRDEGSVRETAGPGKFQVVS